MSAREDILTFKHNIPLMQKNSGLSRVHLADALFENFTGYAARNWRYAAQSRETTVDALLRGTGGDVKVDCAKLRDALKKMFEEDLGLTGVSNVDLNNNNKNGYFMTKPQLRCFDTRVTGNVGNYKSGSYNLASFFSTHYFLRCGGKFYDACMATTYRDETGPVYVLTKPVGTITEKLGNCRYGGKGKATIILRDKAQLVPGFGSVWEVIKLSEVRKAFNWREIKVIKSTPELGVLL